MIYPLNPSDNSKTAALFAPLSYHLATESILAGKTPAPVYVDDSHTPTAAFSVFKHRAFLAGSPGNSTFNQEVSRLIEERIIPGARAEGRDSFVLYCDPNRWEPHLDEVLKDRFPLRDERQYYECDHLIHDWRNILPEEFRMAAVDAALVTNLRFRNLTDLREEMCSERTSVEDFLEKSFGFAILAEDSIASWCLSEHNVDRRCEVGVATAESYQRRGLGTAAALALVEHALQRGCRRIGWHCWKDNVPSAALAMKAGFVHVRDYPSYLCLFDTVVQFALHGHQHRRTGDFEGSLVWYEKALASADAPVWIHVSTAVSLAKLDRIEDSLRHLRLAFQSGFADAAFVRSHPDFECLHAHPGWKTLF